MGDSIEGRPMAVDPRRRRCVLGAWGGLCASAPVVWAAAPPKLQGLRLLTLDGAKWSLAQHKGRVVVLNFWATWCDPCRHEMPTLDALAQDYADQGLVVLAANYKEPAARVRRFVAQTGLGLPVLLDTDGQAARQLGVRLYPTTFVLNRKGDVAEVIAGETDWTDGALRRRIEKLLGAKP